MAAEGVSNRERARSLVAHLGGVAFLRPAAILQAGSLGLTAVGFVASVLLARALGPAGYGTYSLIMSVGTTIGLLRRLGQDYAATSRLAEGYAAGRSRVVRDALVLYVVLSVLTSVLVLPPAMLAAPWIAATFLGGPEDAGLLRLYLVQGFWAVVPGWTVIALQATRRIGALVGFENWTTLIGQLLPVGLALAGFGLLGVFWGQVGASLIALLVGGAVYARLARSDPLLPSAGHLMASLTRPGIALWCETRFGLSIAADKNLVSLFALLPILLLGLVAAEDDVGLLRAALSYMAIPAVLLSPISRLMMVDVPALRARAADEVRPFFVRVTLLGGLASAAIGGTAALAAPLALPLLYGAEFAEAVPLTAALLLDAASLGLGIAAGPIFRAYDRTDLPIRANLLVLALGLPAAFVAVRAWGSFGAALAYAGMLLASRLVAYAQCLRIVAR